MKRFLIMAVVVCAFPSLVVAQVSMPLPGSFFGNCGQVGAWAAPAAMAARHAFTASRYASCCARRSSRVWF